MSSGRTAARAAERVGSGAGRVIRAWRSLPHERRLAAGSAIALFVTLFLPWYQETVIPTGTSRPGALPSASLTGWAAFSPVEAAVLLVAAGVLTLLFIRAEGRAFHVPGGDGGVITAAGFWTCVLIVWRIFDKQGTSNDSQFVTTSGIEWGIFVALVVAAAMAYTGNLIRAAHQPEPPLPGEEPLLKREPDTGGRAKRGAWTPRPVAADGPRQPREGDPAEWHASTGAESGADAPAQPHAHALAQPHAGTPAEPRADTPAEPRAGAPAGQRPESPARPTRRRRRAHESPQRGPEAASDQAAGEPAPTPPPTRRRRPERDNAPERTQAPGPNPDDAPKRTLAARPNPDNAPKRTKETRPGPDNAPKRRLPLDPVPVDSDWEIGEFRTKRLTGDERDRDGRQPPDEQLTIPLEHDDA